MQQPDCNRYMPKRNTVLNIEFLQITLKVKLAELYIRYGNKKNGLNARGKLPEPVDRAWKTTGLTFMALLLYRLINDC